MEPIERIVLKLGFHPLVNIDGMVANMYGTDALFTFAFQIKINDDNENTTVRNMNNDIKIGPIMMMAKWEGPFSKDDNNYDHTYYNHVNAILILSLAIHHR